MSAPDTATIASVIRVESGNPGIDSQAWAALLRRMYLRWADYEGIGHTEEGDRIILFAPPIALDGERGVHRLVRNSPFDHRDRRHSTFANVYINGECAEEFVRSYILTPYTLVKDHRTERETDDAQAVLNGSSLGIFLDMPEAAR